MKKAVISKAFSGLVALVAFAALFQIATAWSGKVIYMTDSAMQGDFWKGKKSVEVGPGAPLAPIQLPGPLDSWAGGESKQITVSLPGDGPVAVTLDFIESHDASPPLLLVESGGRKIATLPVAKGKGVSPADWENMGKPSRLNVTIPGGANQVTLTSVEGSWAALKSITLAPLPPPWAKPVALAGFGLLLVIYFITVVRAGQVKAHLLNALLLLFSVALTVGSVELFLRLFMPQQEFVEKLRTVFVADPDIGYRLKANVKTRIGSDTNRLGFRDYDRYSQAKPAGAYRILFVGDSFTFSWTTLEDSYVKIFESLYQGSESRGGQKIEALNTGVQGWGTDEEYHFIKKFGLDLDPDMILLFFYIGNDITDNCEHPRYTAIDGAMIPIAKVKEKSAEEITDEKRWKLFSNRFHLYRLVANRNYAALFTALLEKNKRQRENMSRQTGGCIARNRGVVSLMRPVENYTPAVKECWRKTKEYLGKIAELAKERNIAFATILIPDEMQFASPETVAAQNAYQKKDARVDWDQPQKNLAGLANKLSIPLFDPLPYLRSQSDGSDIYYCEDTHFNAKGNRLLAEELARWLENNRLLPASAIRQKGPGPS